jgi:uncharacterized protein YebE (UPF0316 family)
MTVVLCVTAWIGGFGIGVVVGAWIERRAVLAAIRKVK